MSKVKTVKEGMFGSSKLIRPGDLEALVNWLDLPKNYSAAVDAISFAPDAKKDDAFVDFISSSPEFQGWDRHMIAQAVDQANERDLMETGTTPAPMGTEGQSVMEKKTPKLAGLIAEAVRKGLTSALEERKKAKVTKISKTKLAEGVRKAVRMALKESGMPGGAMPAPGAGPVAGTAAPTQEGAGDHPTSAHGRSMTFGQMPSEEELQAAWDEAGGFDMQLQGETAMVLDLAEKLAGMPAGDWTTLPGFIQTVKMLLSVKDPGDYYDEDPEEYAYFEPKLQKYDARYGQSDEYLGASIPLNAERLASDMMGALGFEWI